MAGQKFTLTFDAQLNVNQMKGALGQIQSTLNGLHLPQNVTRGLQGTLDQVSKELTSFEAALSKDITSKADFTKLENQAAKVTGAFEKLKIQVKDLSGLSGKDLEKLFPSNVTTNINKATKAIGQYQTAIKSANTEVVNAQNKVNDLVNKINTVQNKTILSPDQFKQLNIDLKDASNEVSDLQNKLSSLRQKQADMEAKLKQPKKSGTYRDLLDEIKQVEQALTQAEQRAQQLAQQKVNSTTYEKQAQDLANLNAKLTEAQQKLAELQKAEKDLQSATNGGGLEKLLAEIGQLTGLDMSKFTTDVSGAKEALQVFINQATSQVSSGLSGLKTSIDNSGKSFQDFRQNVNDSRLAIEQFDTRAREIDSLRSRIQYFFGLNNAIQLVKRTIRSAYQTIKELDKAMTETAVVTDFSVGDMWAQLPEYTARANELGVTTKAAYEAATLFYQQGLKTNEVMAMSNETLKMARIAGLDAAVATDRMTNAIRGFNMEINETNAQRIDDVYSRLAAISASNVDEISTAMTKVASLAHNANMEFETTAAFLAQIIETTRESAETAGTALKTVVARFSEVKKLVDEGELRGESEEGELIDVNKVSEALRTAGIDLNKYFLGEVGLDDIFMELASKWDSLTTIQQRYIATQAAGSRQQSRFIALMSDYARTQELVGEAYNANGAAAKQFAKTQESLESKLARLKNAWNEFAMGIMNSDLVKAGVDLLTDLLNVVNQLTSGFGTLKEGAGSFVSSLLKIGLLLGGLNLGKGLASGLFASAAGVVTGKPLAAGEFGGIMRTAMLGQGAKGAMANMANRSMAGTLAAGFLNPFAGIGMTAKGLVGGLQQLGGRAVAGYGGIFGKVGAGLFNSKLLAGVGETASFGLAGLASVATALAGVTAAAAGAYAIIKKLYDLTPEGQAKIAQKYANALQNVADSASNAAAEIKRVQSDYQDYTNKINDAKDVGERVEAIKDRNEYITSLLEQNAAYAEYVTSTFENGEILLTLDEDALATAVDKIAEGAIKVKAYSEMANAMAAGAQANIYRNRLSEVDLENGTRTIVTQGNTMMAMEHTQTVELTPEERAKYLRAQTAAESSEAEMRGYAKTAISQLLDTDMLSDEMANGIAELMSRSFDAQALSSSVQTQQRENWWAGEATDTQLRLKYKELIGVEAGKDVEKADLAKEVAFAEVMQDTTEKQIEQVQNLISQDTSGIYDAVLKAYTGEGKISKLNLDQFDLEGDPKKLFDALGVTDTGVINLAEAMDITGEKLNEYVDDLQAGIVAQAKLNKEVQRVNKSKIYENMLRNGTTVTKKTQEDISALTPEQAARVADITTQAQGIVSQESYDNLINQIPELVQSAEFEDVQRFFDSFDLSDPIKAFEQLREAESNAAEGGIFEGLLKDIEELNQEILSSGNLFREMTQSAEFEDIEEDLSKLVEENGKITSDKVRELAAKCGTLNSVLKKDKISAEGLAKALTGLQTGNISIEGLTTRVLEALSVSTQWDTMLQHISKVISEFDPGRDYGEGSDFLVQQSDNLLELIEGYEFGNPQTENIYDLLFGKGQYDQFMTDWGTRGADEYAALLQTKVEQIKDWAANNSYGFMRDFSGNEALGITQRSEYDFDWDTQGRTTDEIVAEVSRQAQISKEAAEMIVEGFAAQSYDFATELQNNDYSAWLTDFADKAGNTRVITEQELDAMAAAFGKSSDEIYADLQKIMGKDVPVRVTWVDGDGKPLEAGALQKAFEDSLGEAVRDAAGNVDYSKYVEDALIDSNTIDANALMSKLQTDGLTPEQATEMANKIAESLDKQLGETVLKPQMKVDESTGESIIESVNEVVRGKNIDELKTNVEGSLKQADYSILATQLTQVDLTQAGLTISSAVRDAINSGASDGATAGAAAMQQVFDANPPVVTVFLNPNVDELNKAIEAYQGAILTINSNASANVGTGTGGSGQKAATGGIVRGRMSVEAQQELSGIVRSYAAGTPDSGDHFLQPGWALTGEEGPEIVWNKELGYSYITGANGPEFQKLQPGDRVFNAPETERILRNTSFAAGGIYGSYAYGGYNKKKIDEYYEKSSSGSGSGGSDPDGDDSDTKTPTVWQNEIDWIYNLVQDVEMLQRQQTKLSEKHSRQLEDIRATGADLYQTSKVQLNNLYTLRDNQRETLRRRTQEMYEQIGISGYERYVQWNQKDQTLEIDWDAIEAIQDKDTYDEVKELISKAEGIQDKIQKAQDDLFNIEKDIKDIEDRYLEEFTNFQSRVLDAVIAGYQKTIDNLDSLSETIDEANNSVLASLQEEINYSRQIRDNTQTEDEISRMEARLAYLRRDTTQGNASEIRQLEEQIKNSREQYEDTLVDQSLSRLADENAKASEQRQQQITLMQAQLDYWKETGALWAEANKLIAEGIGQNGSIIRGSDLEITLRGAEDWKSMSEEQKEVWANDLILASNQAGAYLLKISEGLDGISKGVWANLPMSSVVNQKLDWGEADRTEGEVIADVQGTNAEVQQWLRSYYQQLQDKLRKEFGYSSGGLNTQTGLAMLHGTPNEPEYVLNARQTDAFLKLADVLPSMLGDNTTTNNFGGNVYVDLNMNVDQIANDYDVDRLVERVKQDIYDVSSYRNVNSIGFIR